MRTHAELPWTIYRCQFADEIGAPGQVACGFNDESLDMSRDECHHPLTMADAELVIKAVNNHYELVFQLKKAIHQLRMRKSRTPKEDETIATAERLIAELPE